MSDSGATTCPWCNAPRTGEAKCPNCGALYAKAEALRAGRKAERGATPASAVALPEVEEVDGFRSDGLFGNEIKREKLVRALAIPGALAIAALFHASPFGQMIQRTFLSMFPHELGHAVTAWLCGFTAIPTPLWVTMIPEERGYVGSAIVVAAVVFLAHRGVNHGKKFYFALSGLLAFAGLFGTFGLSLSAAHAMITFGGDGGGMILGTVLMLCFYAPANTNLVRGCLRWGLLVIGSATYVDLASTWWSARKNWDAIPFGENVGMCLSDPSKLTEVYGWGTQAMVNRYLWIAAVCLVALAIGWARGLLLMSLRRTAGQK